MASSSNSSSSGAASGLAPAAEVPAGGTLFLNAELSAYAVTLIVPAVWRDVILPYLPFTELHPLIRWSRSEQLQSLRHTFECEFECIVGVLRWRALKAALIAHRAVITGTWPFQIIMGRRDAEEFSQLDIVRPVATQGASTIVCPITNMISSWRRDECPMPVIHNRPGVLSASAVRIKGTQIYARITAVHVADSTTPDALIPWIEYVYDFDCRRTTYNPAHPTTPVYVSPSTSIDRLFLRQTAFRCVGDPRESWALMWALRDKGVVFDPIDPAVLRSQLEEYMHGRASVAYLPEYPPPSLLFLDVIHFSDRGPTGRPLVFRTTDRSSPAMHSMQCMLYARRCHTSNDGLMTFSISRRYVEPCDLGARCIYSALDVQRHVHVGASFDMVLLVHYRDAPANAAASCSATAVGSKRAAVGTPIPERSPATKRHKAEPNDTATASST